MAAAAELSQLQDKIKRDKASYRDDFLLQYNHFLSELELFRLEPNTKSKEFSTHARFISQVAPFYAEEVRDFPRLLASLLEDSGQQLQPEIRLQLVKCLILLRNRNTISLPVLFPLFFKLFPIQDKHLRELMHGHLSSDIRRCNTPRKNVVINKVLQNYFQKIVIDTSSVVRLRKAIKILIELYRKNIWNDSRTINMISEGLFSKDTKTMVATLQFFLSDRPLDEDQTLDNEQKQEKKDDNREKSKIFKTLTSGHAKMTKKRKRKIHKFALDLKKEKNRSQRTLQPNFPAIQMINDPQGLAERIFGFMKKSNERFEIRVLMLNLISRLIAVHELQLDPFYPWVQRYLQPHQEQITHFLVIISQACHPLVNPDVIIPIVKTIANHFVSDHCSSEAMTIGLNSIREICLRCPYSMDATLLQDLVQYKTSKDKGVAMAARSLISLFRDIDPNMLHKKDRGRGTRSDSAVPVFGQMRYSSGVDGIELLEEEEGEEEESKKSSVKLSATDTTVGDDEEDDDEEDDEDEEMAGAGEDESDTAFLDEDENSAEGEDDENEDGDEDEDVSGQEEEEKEELTEEEREKNQEKIIKIKQNADLEPIVPSKPRLDSIRVCLC